MYCTQQCADCQDVIQHKITTKYDKAISQFCSYFEVSAGSQILLEETDTSLPV